MNRRDFLKLLSAFPPALYLPPSVTQVQDSSDPAFQNIVVIIFDSWSAENLSLYGYQRQTTPHLERLAEKAIVYHNHYSSGHYTYPSTSSLLTGVLPWTHRGQMIGGSEILPEFNSKNLFSLFDTHHRYAYTHNKLADDILLRMIEGIDNYTSPSTLSLENNLWYEDIFQKDSDNAIVGWTRSMDKLDDGYANTLLFSRLYGLLQNHRNRNLATAYPRGLSEMYGTVKFIQETSTDWVNQQIKNLYSPSISYYHFLPPHDPYCTRIDFYNQFKNDGFKPTPKPYHIIAKEDVTHEMQSVFRQEYDEYILLVDSEIGRLMDALETSGALENTWIFLTSDHGEMFERGLPNHGLPSMHQPLIHIPLMVFPPGNQERLDIYTPTTTTDLLPTFLHLNQKPFPDWLEGKILPPWNTTLTNNRGIYSIDGRHNPQTGPYTNGTVALMKGDFKLIYLFGKDAVYSPLAGKPVFELYDLKNDPEEIENLYNPNNQIFKDMFGEMSEQMYAVGVR